MIEYKAGRKMVIGICDDDKKWRESCKRTLIGFSTMIDMGMEVMCFSTAEELLEYKETPLDAVFLDIELGRANGIFVAKKLNKVRPNCKIIYMTNYLHYATEIYNTEHIWFVIKSKFTDKIGDISYQISPLSFFQVNPLQTGKLYSKALEYADLHGEETVWDLYCGIGTISLFLAQKAKFVRGVEIIPAAIENANDNARLNSIENVEFFVGKAEEVLPAEYKKNGIYADVIVVDPPRKGCEESLLATMIEMKPKRIVYVSCDSATLARDLKYLCERGYELRKVCPVDQFGGTVHVETCVLLSKLKSTPHIEVEINLDEMDLSRAESKATYAEIKDYVLKNYGMNVTNLYIAQVKRKYGIIERINYNLGEGKTRVPQVTAEKEEAIEDALRHFQMIS